MHIGPRRLEWAALALALGSIQLGCPNTTPSAVEINNVEVKGSLKDRSFQLVLSGHGFGLSSIQYDLSSGTGTSSAADYKLRLIDHTGMWFTTIGGNKVMVLSTTRIEAQVDLDQPLEGGIHSPYDIDLSFGETKKTLSGALIVPAGSAPDGGGPSD